MDEILLLDTHVWVWLVNGDARLSRHNFQIIDEAIRVSKARVSIISIWEIATLVRKGRMSLPYHCLEWVKKSLEVSGIILSELTPMIAVESALLSNEYLKDPADRIIMVTGKYLGARIVTADKPLMAYCKETNLPVLSV